MPDVSFLEKRMRRREFITTTAASAVGLMLGRAISKRRRLLRGWIEKTGDKIEAQYVIF